MDGERSRGEKRERVEREKSKRERGRRCEERVEMREKERERFGERCSCYGIMSALSVRPLGKKPCSL